MYIIFQSALDSGFRWGSEQNEAMDIFTSSYQDLSSLLAYVFNPRTFSLHVLLPQRSILGIRTPSLPFSSFGEKRGLKKQILLTFQFCLRPAVVCRTQTGVSKVCVNRQFGCGGLG